MPRSDSITVLVRMRGSRTFQANAAKNAAALEAMGVKGAAGLTKVASASKKLTSVGSSMTRGITVPVVAGAAVVTKFAYDFDTAMRNVNSIAQLPEKQLASLSDQVLALAGPTAQAPQTLAEGLYDLVSSGFDAKESLTILKASATAATAGLTDAATSTKAVSAVLNSYRLPASKAGFVSDVLFKTVDRGVISFEELSTTIGKTLPIASQMGVGIDDLGASIATLTKGGLSGAEANTDLRGALVQMIKPTEGLKNAYKALGVESGQQLIKQKGFQGALEALVGATDGTAQSVGKLFTNQRALTGVLRLTGANAKGARKDLKDFGDVQGATATALSQQKKSLSYQVHQLSARLQALAIKVAPPVIAALKTIVNHAIALTKTLTKLPDGVGDLALKFILLSAAMGPVLWIIGKLLSGWVALAGGLATLINVVFAARQAWIAYQVEGAAVAVTNYGIVASMLAIAAPVLAIVAAVALVAAAFVLAYTKVEVFRNVVDAVVGWIVDHWKLLAGLLTANISWVVIFFVQHWETIKAVAVRVFKIIGGAFKVVAAVAKAVFNVIKTVAKVAFAVIIVATKPLQLILIGAFKAIKAVAVPVWHAIADVASAAWEKIKSVAVPVWNWLRGAAKKIGEWFSDAWHVVSSGVSSAFEAVKGAVVSALNFIIGRINDLIGVMNSAISAFNKLPGPDIGEIGTIGEIPTPQEVANQATGGGKGPKHPSADVAPTGGAGPNNKVMPRPAVTGSVAAATAGGNGGTTTTIIPVNLDGKKIAEVVARHGEKARARR